MRVYRFKIISNKPVVDVMLLINLTEWCWAGKREGIDLGEPALLGNEVFQETESDGFFRNPIMVTEDYAIKFLEKCSLRTDRHPFITNPLEHIPLIKRLFSTFLNSGKQELGLDLDAFEK